MPLGDSMLIGDVISKIELFSKYSAIPTLLLSQNNEIIYCTYGAKKTQQIPMIDQFLSLSDIDKCPKVVVFNGIELYSIFDCLIKHDSYRVIVGPVLSVKPLSEKYLNILSFSDLFPMETVRRFVKSIPQMTYVKFVHYLEIFFYIITEKLCPFESIAQNKETIQTLELVHEYIGAPEYESFGFHPSASAYEDLTALYDAIKTGDINRSQKILSQSMILSLLITTNTKDNFNRFVAATSVLAKAAIDAGLPYEDVQSIGVALVKYAEDLHSEADFLRIYKTMVNAYTTRIDEETHRKQYPQSISKAIAYIEERLHYPISLDEIAAHVKLSRAYFSQLFAKETGTPLQKYITLQKIHEAEELLKYTKESIREISESLSFCSQSYFTEVFKEINQITPFQYRKQFKRNM
jgi:AraC-like DNA-binding protein